MKILSYSLFSIVLAALFSQASFADDNTYTIDVTLHAYYGEAGHDGHGGHLYKVKVSHGHHQYYVYLHQTIEGLGHGAHDHAGAHVVVSRGSERWLSLSYNGHFARVHKVTRIHHD
ncbi:MAG: hypothetical protein L3J39_10360 [Verrucomicrobiales bacterium]|nr:hypothetical protein [Verrucomicrobiales bacterium]